MGGWCDICEREVKGRVHTQRTPYVVVSYCDKHWKEVEATKRAAIKVLQNSQCDQYLGNPYGDAIRCILKQDHKGAHIAYVAWRTPTGILQRMFERR